VGVPKKTHRAFFGYVPGCLNPALSRFSHISLAHYCQVWSR